VGDVDAMAGFCLKLLADCAGAKAYAQAARKRAVEVFDYRTIVPQYERIYERVLS